VVSVFVWDWFRSTFFKRLVRLEETHHILPGRQGDGRAMIGVEFQSWLVGQCYTIIQACYDML